MRSPQPRVTGPRGVSKLHAVGAGTVRDVGALKVEVGHPLCGGWALGRGPGLVDRSKDQETIGEGVVTVEQLAHRPPEPAAIGLAKRPEERRQPQRAALLLADGQRVLRIQRTPATASSRMTSCAAAWSRMRCATANRLLRRCCSRSSISPLTVRCIV